MSDVTTLRTHLRVAAESADEQGKPVWAMLMRDAADALEAALSTERGE